jgi:hypothetical protein|tara:strand:+ start:297 stop:1124 length:828 start_codon:yes stop_codon:yes gene_type:complete
MSTLKADAISSASSNTDCVITGAGSGVPDIEASFKVGGVAGVPTASIRDDAVTLAKLATGTDGELITWDASGDPAAVAVGTATHVLTSNGTGAAPTFQAAAGGGAWTLIGTVAASTSATLTVTGIDTTYGIYAIGLSAIIPTADNYQLGLRVGDSGGIDSGATDYEFHTCLNEPDSATYQATASTGSNWIMLHDGIGNASGESGGGMFYLTNGGDTLLPQISGIMQGTASPGIFRAGTVLGQRKASIAVTQVQILFQAGANILSGRLTVWGIAHA